MAFRKRAVRARALTILLLSAFLLSVLTRCFSSSSHSLKLVRNDNAYWKILSPGLKALSDAVTCHGISFESPDSFLPANDATGLPRAEIFTSAQRGTLLHSQNSRLKIETGESDAPDAWIQLVLARVLRNCKRRSCLSVDLGSNLGLLSMRMLQHGSRVIAVEPQADLSCAAETSSVQNGFKHSVHFIRGGVYHERSNRLLSSTEQYRYGGTINVSKLYEDLEISLPIEVPIFYIGDILAQNRYPLDYNFIKIDTDSLDCELLSEILSLQEQGRLRFTTASLETWAGAGCEEDSFSILLSRLQSSGYEIYRARNDATDDYKHLTSHALTLSRGITVWKFPKMHLNEWKNVGKEWRGEYQMLVSNLPPQELGQVDTIDIWQAHQLENMRSCIKENGFAFSLNGLHCPNLVKALHHGTGKPLGSLSTAACRTECCSRPICTAWQFKFSQGCYLASDGTKYFRIEQSTCISGSAGKGWIGGTMFK
mmetsp:Transcript_6153/g.24464  ORF Transcript_6153/g.24464 Transcript_6153/m.24464 type:complete len:482 (+) Transcript_6153:147-1592(+)